MKKKLPQRRWVSLWRHFYDREQTTDGLTAAMIEWQEKWGWDFLKLNPAACYHVLDWGTGYSFFDDPMLEPKLFRPVVSNPEDVDRIGALDVHQGVLGGQLETITRLRSHFGAQLPIVQTVFSPIEIAHRLMPGRATFLDLLRRDRPAVERLLETIRNVFMDYVTACLAAGADGIFFATKWARSEYLSWEEYEQLAKKHETDILSAVQDKNGLAILHVCGGDTHLAKMLDYPVDIFSYDFSAHGVPSPEEVSAVSGKFVLGGIDPGRLVSDPDSVRRDCSRYAALPGWLAGPSCVVLPETPDSTISQLQQALCFRS